MKNLNAAVFNFFFSFAGAYSLTPTSRLPMPLVGTEFDLLDRTKHVADLVGWAVKAEADSGHAAAATVLLCSSGTKQIRIDHPSIFVARISDYFRIAC
ncbi:hypothetical protein [Mangrovibacterium marinum]|uniref:hypothetical protein n=1 Tax=Mangrovibacterium marinum TaxID=1639118 RepID=UPI000D311E58|nr:hypothetical protein [Mangrovibacterium marinum]